MTDQPRDITRTHNQPPLELPSEEAMLAELKHRYPELEQRLTEWETALKTFRTSGGELPKFTLKDSETAEALQDLLGQIDKVSRA